MMGTTFCCGMALCGACTVRLERQAIRSCVTPVGATPAGKKRLLHFTKINTPSSSHKRDDERKVKQVLLNIGP
jgi:isoquinoline 1-oxidoreductase subunit alpha